MLSVIIVLVNGRRRARHFSPRRVLSVIVVLVHGLAVAEPDGAFHLVMMSQNSNQMPWVRLAKIKAPLLGHLMAVHLCLVTCGPLHI